MKTILSSDGFTATIESKGAELVSVRGPDGHEWIWPGTAPWPQSAPVLFPIIGRPGGDAIRWDDQSYPMPIHGFVASEELKVTEKTPSRAVFLLMPNAATQALFPFEFRFFLSYALSGGNLAMEIAVINPADTVLPVQFGLHPGFVVPGMTDDNTIVRFAADEGAEVQDLRVGRLAEPRPSPVAGRVLRIGPETFAEGGMMFDDVKSEWVWYGVPGQPGVKVQASGFPQLGLWSKPPGRYLCIEPWNGIPDRADFAGALNQRGNVTTIPPGGAAGARCQVTFGASEPA